MVAPGTCIYFVYVSCVRHTHLEKSALHPAHFTFYSRHHPSMVPAIFTSGDPRLPVIIYFVIRVVLSSPAFIAV